ncbi:MAG: YhdP family protein [Burkholderiales bacterium]
MLRALEALAWVAFFVLAIAFLASRYWLLPRVEQHREAIVAQISRAVGLPVRIGALAADWQGLRLRLSVTDVRVYDHEGREALVLPAVENVLAWRSLFVGELRLHSSMIEGPKLEVRRTPGGEIYIAGIRVAGDKSDGRLGDWILSQDRIEIRGAEIEWLDESRRAPALRLSSLNFRLENDGDEHRVGVSARPPRELGPGLELRARLEGRSVREAARWNGRVYAEFGYTDLAGWRAWVDYPLDIRRGAGALRVWATLEAGRLSQATADVALSGVLARLGRELPLLEISAVRGRVYGRQTVQGYDFGVRNLSLQRPSAPPMNGTSFRASWQPAGANAPAARGALNANLIELGPLAHLAEYLPFPGDVRALLAELAPHGNLLDARFEWTGELPDQATYLARTRFTGLSVRAWRSIPGFANLSGSLDANEKKGTLVLGSRKSEIDLPKVFPEPRIALDALGGEISWERAADGALAVRIASLNYANADLAGTAYGSYAWRGEGAGVIDLTAQLQRADGRATARYLPLSSVMGERTREWVARAVLAGQASEARLRLKGDLRDFPFVDPAQGQFQVTAKLSDAVLDYAEGWPRIEAIEGSLQFDRDRIEVAGQSGSILGVKLANVRVTLPSMLDPNPHLVIDGTAEGPTSLFLDYVRDSPVRRMTDGFTEAMSALGRGKLKLRLDLALSEAAKSKLAGEFQFSGNTLTLDPRLPPVERASGRVSFTESSLALGDVRAQLLGGELRLSGGSRGEAGVVIAAEGRATIEGLRTLFDHPWRRRLSGATRYSAAVVVKEGRAQLTLDSTLEGIASALPAPLAKVPSETLPLRVEVYPGEGRDRVSVALGPPTGRIVAAEILRGATAGEAPAAAGAMQVQRTLILLNPVTGETPSIPERRGTTVRGSLPALDLERWLPLFAEGGIAGGAPGSGDGAGYDVRIGVLDALGKRMRSVVLQGVADASGWSANLNAVEFAGDVVYRTEGSGRLVARFTRFTIPEDSPNAKPAEATKDLPAVDIVADNFTHRGRKLGRVEVLARHEGRDWRIDKLAMTNADFVLTGSGLWKQGEAQKAAAAASRTSLAFKLEVSDVGHFLERFGHPEHLKGGRAKLEGALNWNGDPVTLDYTTLGGQMQMQAENGQFLEIEPGIGKLVSLMSLQMLPRRISMDFRDVFSKGFQFDKITSNLAIERGVMAVKDFHMNGPAADVMMNGQVDLSLETQNLNVKVIPQLGDTASTVVGLVNPIAGVATLIAGRLMKNPLGKIFAFDYSISGTWSDPKVDKLQPTTQSVVAPADLALPTR